jgi:hypothetical protein
MGYEHRACKATCGACGNGVWWSWEDTRRTPPKVLNCAKCDSRNVLRRPPEWPNVPRVLYIGHDKHRQMTVHPFPPHDTETFLPYSTRSFMAQASKRLGGCAYATQVTATVMGQPVFSDRCSDAVDAWTDHDCHMLAGFGIGETTCALWEEVAKLCQTEIEKQFLRWYLELVKDRQFPMLIPQARIGIAERRRPDFVVFVPVHYWSYKWYAIQLDAAHGSERTTQDRIRDEEIAVQGYEVISLRPSREGYLGAVKRLLEQIERDMAKVEGDGWSVAIQLEVARTEPAQDSAAPWF